MEELINDAQPNQAELSKRLNALVSRFSEHSLQLEVDFDHLVNDGFTDEHGNLLSQAGALCLSEGLSE